MAFPDRLDPQEKDLEQMEWRERKKSAVKCSDLLSVKIKNWKTHWDMSKSNWLNQERITSNWPRNSKKLKLIFKVVKSRSQDNQTSTTHKLNKSKKWERNWTVLPMTREKCLRSLRLRWTLIKMRSTLESNKSKNLKKKMSKKMMISRCMNLD